MKRVKGISILLVAVLVLSLPGTPSGFAQESVFSNSLANPSSKEKLHALALTRFHFITLKQFHSGLFSLSGDSNSLPNSEAQILNTGLNAFLNSPERETMLLDALRHNKAVELRFSIPSEDKAYQVLDHPTKPLLYRLKPMVQSVPASIEIKPLLDKPIAFQITLEKNNRRSQYEVDWAGGLASLA